MLRITKSFAGTDFTLVFNEQFRSLRFQIDGGGDIVDYPWTKNHRSIPQVRFVMQGQILTIFVGNRAIVYDFADNVFDFVHDTYRGQELQAEQWSEVEEVEEVECFEMSDTDTDNVVEEDYQLGSEEVEESMSGSAAVTTVNVETSVDNHSSPTTFDVGGILRGDSLYSFSSFSGEEF